MQILSIQSMQTMQYLPRIDRKMLGYAVSWIVVIAATMVGVAVYA